MAPCAFERRWSEKRGHPGFHSGTQDGPVSPMAKFLLLLLSPRYREFSRYLFLRRNVEDSLLAPLRPCSIDLRANLPAPAAKIRFANDAAHHVSVGRLGRRDVDERN